MAERRFKIRAALAATAATVALAVPTALAQADATEPAPVVQGDSLDAPAATPLAPVEHGETIVPPATKSSPNSNGGLSAGANRRDQRRRRSRDGRRRGEPRPDHAAHDPLAAEFDLRLGRVPPVLIPIFQRAAAAYGLGPQGPAVLAGINEVETAFGTNLNVSSAGAIGWMQFMPSSWAEFGVDGNGDGVKDPYNPEDAIFAAASYLHIAGMPTDTYGAIFAYNHADWYVSEVLANAGCYAGEVGRTGFNAAGLGPQVEVLRCEPAPGWRRTSRRPTSKPSRTRPPAMNSASAESGHWPRSRVL